MKHKQLLYDDANTEEMHDRLRAWEAQARQAGPIYSAPQMPRETPDAPPGMLYWVAEAARGLRIACGRILSQVAAGIPANQSKVSRFENHRSKGFPYDPDKLIAAYASNLDIDAPEIWLLAVELWQLDRATPGGVSAEVVTQRTQEVYQRSRGANPDVAKRQARAALEAELEQAAARRQPPTGSSAAGKPRRRPGDPGR